MKTVLWDPRFSRQEWAGGCSNVAYRLRCRRHGTPLPDSKRLFTTTAEYRAVTGRELRFFVNRSAPLPCSIDSMKKFETRMGGLLTDRSDDGEGDQRAY